MKWRELRVDWTDTRALPAPGAHVTRHPRNQWLANALAAQRDTRPLYVRKAGEEARWYVRGGMAPEYATPAQRDALFKRLVRERRMEAAMAFLRGWVEHHPDDRPAEADVCRKVCEYAEDVGVWATVPCGIHEDYVRHVRHTEPVERQVHGWAWWVHYRQRYVLGLPPAGTEWDGDLLGAGL